MIKSFQHRGLKKFFETGSKAGIQPAHARRIADQLTALNAASRLEMMDVAGWKLHALQGELAGHWSIRVNGNWRITFRFNGPDAEVVDYQDYH